MTATAGLIGLWQRAGVLVYLAHQLDPVATARAMVDNHFGWIAIQTHDGTNPVTKAPHGDTLAWLKPFRDAGIRVGGWGVLRTDPVNDARLAVYRQRELGLSFYLGDAELEYKYTGPDGKPCSECFERSQMFVSAFRKLAPAMPAAVSSYPRFDMADLHWAAWHAAGFRAAPQAYFNEFGAFASPTAAVNGAVNVKQPQNVMRDLRGNVIPGWPRSWVHPTIGLYDVGARPHVTAEEWVDLLDKPGVPPGFSLYLGEFLAGRWEDWAVFGAGIRDRGIALY